MENKKVTSIRIPATLLKEAQELGLNVSKICENALKEAVRKLKAPDPKTMTNGGVLECRQPKVGSSASLIMSRKRNKFARA